MSLTKKTTPNLRSKRFKYSESMVNAIDAVKNGGTLNNGVLAYNVPKSTLHSRVTGKIIGKGKMGPKSILTEDEEEDLKRWILEKAQVGFPMHADEVKDAVQKILLESPRENKDNFL
uniref:PAG1 protein n=1 Tax=Fopius arisanus TaxID=64838 RepID=A0A0C9QJB0_9HYME